MLNSHQKLLHFNALLNKINTITNTSDQAQNEVLNGGDAQKLDWAIHYCKGTAYSLHLYRKH